MLARLRLLLAMSLLCLGAWFAALALEGYLPAASAAMGPRASPGQSASRDAQQFISVSSRERFVVEGAPTTKPQVKSQLNSHTKPQPETKSPEGASKLEKRRPASTAQLPWPLNLFSDWAERPCSIRSLTSDDLSSSEVGDLACSIAKLAQHLLRLRAECRRRAVKHTW